MEITNFECKEIGRNLKEKFERFKTNDLTFSDIEDVFDIAFKMNDFLENKYTMGVQSETVKTG